MTTLPKQILEVATMSKRGLQEQCIAINNGRNINSYSRNEMVRVLTFLAQGIMLGEMDNSLATVKVKQQSNKPEDILKNGRQGVRTSLKPNTKLEREYQGKIYQINISAAGDIIYENRIYPSLTQLAREITGTACSGTQFFSCKTKIMT